MFFSMPVEMPRATHYGNNYFAVYSNKIHRVCHFYSNLEYYNFLSLEINPEVKKFCEQPHFSDGSARTAYPGAVLNLGHRAAHREAGPLAR